MPKDKCIECESINLVYDHEAGETVCMDCGMVQPYKEMDKGPERRAFNPEEMAKRTRVGPPVTYAIHDKGLSTAISHIDRDAHGKKLPLSTRLQMYRLRKWQIRTRIDSSVDRNLAQANNEIKKLIEKLQISNSVKEDTAIIYRKALDKGLIRGRSIAAVAAAALYLACRQKKTSRTLTEISEASTSNKKDVGRSYRLLQSELDIQVPVVDSRQYFNKLGLTGKSEEIASKILNTAKQYRLTSGRNPTGLAAAAAYIGSVVSGDKKTQKDLAYIANVTEVTIRNRYKTLMRELYIITTL